MIDAEDIRRVEGVLLATEVRLLNQRLLVAPCIDDGHSLDVCQSFARSAARSALDVLALQNALDVLHRFKAQRERDREHDAMAGWSTAQ